MSAEPTRRRYSGHETFALRPTWLPKAAARLSQGGPLFGQEDAFVRLGVGKNMATSVAYWSDLTGATEGDRGQTTVLSAFGETVLGKEGLDPYLELPESLWLLHWNANGRTGSSGVAGLMFSKWAAPRFTDTNVVAWVQEQLLIPEEAERVSRTPSEVVIQRDLAVMLSMYNADARGDAEFASAFRGLNLISSARGQRGEATYRFNIGHKPGLTPDVLAYALESFWSAELAGQNSVRLENVMHPDGSPARVLKLDVSSFCALLDAMPEWAGYHYSVTAGQAVLYRDEAPLRSHAEMAALVLARGDAA